MKAVVLNASLCTESLGGGSRGHNRLTREFTIATHCTMSLGGGGEGMMRAIDMREEKGRFY